ncbi:hypothetical protein ACH470_38990 [Streptomyces bottropensis]|uniref:hypothetical protein n=1 Tax=Streptomyces bottropensis TaxID=42235 RepID=UPI0037B10300
MSTLTTPRITPPARGNRVRWRIPARLRKSIFVTHVVAAGAWIGIDVSAVLVAVGWVREGDDRTAVYGVLADFFVVPLLLSALVAG